MSQWPGWDEDQLAMLKDSYREVTGHEMPPDMDPAKATEELRRQFSMFMETKEPADDETPQMLFSVILAAARLKKAMLRGRRRRQKEAADAAAKREAEEKAKTEAQAKEHHWDPEQLEMLKASYMEVTGRPMPSYYAPFQAMEELRRLVPNIAAEDDSPQDTILVIMAAAKLKRRWLANRRGSLVRKAKQAGVPVAEYKGPAFEMGDFGRVKEKPAWQVMEEEAAEAAAESKAEAERIAKVREQMGASLTSMHSDVFKPQEQHKYKASGAKVYEGWLLKKQKSMLKSDKQRWFVLHEGGELHYFADPDSLDKQVGMVSLKGLSASDVKALTADVKPGEMPQVFIIENAERTGSGGASGKSKDWILDAGAPGACTTWVKQLKGVISKAASGHAVDLS